MKTKKIAAGYYTFTYKNQEVQIVKTEMPEENYRVYWYFQINGSDANDYQNSKKQAIEDAMYLIDNADMYDFKLR